MVDTKLHSQYSEDKFIELLERIHSFSGDGDSSPVIEAIRLVSEFICYSEKQPDLNYFDLLMSYNTLLVDLPRILALDCRSINIQML
jgi:hypothetical protein